MHQPIISEVSALHIAEQKPQGVSSLHAGGPEAGGEFTPPPPAEEPRTVLAAAVAPFAQCARVDSLVVTIPAGDRERALAALGPLGPRVELVEGGPSRRSSVYAALQFLAAGVPPPGWVLIHDGARPWVTLALIERVIDAMLEHRAVLPVLPLVETPKELDENGFVTRHLRRAALAAAQTPQAFAFAPLLAAHEQAARLCRDSEAEFTDDAEVWGAFAGPVFTIPGEPGNRKITFPDDLRPAAQEQAKRTNI